LSFYLIGVQGEFPQFLCIPYTQTLEVQMQELHNRLPEKSRRLYAGIEALKLPYGGVSYIARLFDHDF